MPDADDECKHGMPAGTCSSCSGRDQPTAGTGTRAGVGSQSLDSPAAVEHYRKRYPGDREPTFDAYVDVFFGVSGARTFSGGFTNFTRCANAEPALVEGEPALVARAEELMRLCGYVHDDSHRARGGGRRWRRA